MPRRPRPWLRPLLCLFTGLWLAPPLALADEPLKLCGDTAKDACLQELSAFTKELALEQAAPKGAFDLRRRPAQSSDRWDIFILLDADEAIDIDGKSVRPTLVMRCLDNTTNAFVAFESDVAEKALPVFSRIDNAPWSEETWTAAKDGQGIFPGENFIAFLKSLREHRVFRLWLKPKSGDAAAITFNISGLHEALAPLYEACRWR